MSVIALDRSQRTKDQDGRLHIAWTPISKATVNPYYGREIPGFQELGLDPDRIYQLWRHPEELSRAAATFNNVQVMSRHVAVSADSPQEDQVAGSLGTDCEFRPPYLGNSMVIWRAEDIAAIEAGTRRQISAGYYYRADMTPGITMGLRYDGIMRDIRANHVALVEAGRAGPDVLVTDSGETIMPTALASRHALIVKGALTALLKPNLMPGTTLALDQMLGSVNRLNWKTEKSKVLATVLDSVKSKLATDMKMETLAAGIKLAFDKMDEEDDADAEDDEIGSMDSEEEEETKRMKREEEAKDKKARDKKARDTKAAKDAKAKDEKEDDDEDDKEDKAEDMKKAMDSAIGSAVDKIKADLRDATEAREMVRPLIGKVDLAMDSAEDIYRLALDAAKVAHKGVHPSALKTLVGMAIKQQAQPSRRELAMDSTSDAGIHAKFPMLSRIGQG